MPALAAPFLLGKVCSTGNQLAVLSASDLTPLETKHFTIWSKTIQTICRVYFVARLPCRNNLFMLHLWQLLPWYREEDVVNQIFHLGSKWLNIEPWESVTNIWWIRESQDSLLRMRFKLRLFMMSWAESTTWPWLFGRDPSCVIFSTCENRAPCVCTLGRSASSSTLDTRKICTTLLFLCSRCKIFIAFFWAASHLCLKLWFSNDPCWMWKCCKQISNCEIKSICKQIFNCEIKSPSAANKSPILDVIQNIDAQLVCHQGLVAGLPCLASTRKKRWCTICHFAIKFRLFAHRTMAV